MQEPEEQRSAGAVAVHAAYGLTIYLAARVGDEIVATVRRRLRRSRAYRGRRPGVIYGPRHEVLREFELPEGDAGDADE